MNAKKTQTISLTIPKEILQKAKLIAAERNTALSELLTQILVEMIARHERYAQAHSRNLELLNTGLNLGTHGNLKLNRRELHERND